MPAMADYEGVGKPAAARGATVFDDGHRQTVRRQYHQTSP